MADQSDKYARWHAIHAIGFGIVAFLVAVVVSLVPFLGDLLGALWNVVVLIGIIVLAVKAYQGDTIRLPVIADYADKHA